jgi:hypothetical protein
MTEYPDKTNNEDQLEELLSRPGTELSKMFLRVEGDIMFLGVGGKIGHPEPDHEIIRRRHLYFAGQIIL